MRCTHGKYTYMDICVTVLTIYYTQVVSKNCWQFSDPQLKFFLPLYPQLSLNKV